MKLTSVVKIDIKDPSRYTDELYNKINGKTGLVLIYKEYERKYGVDNKALLDIAGAGQWWIPESDLL